jgi:hypothetical protein
MSVMRNVSVPWGTPDPEQLKDIRRTLGSMPATT